MMIPDPVSVVGGGLAGAEAAWQIAKRGLRVLLYEMRPIKSTPAHSTGKFAELVCSNSLGAKALTNAGGILKEEMRLMDSLVMKAADSAAIPAGGALAVDRDEFSDFITGTLEEHPLVTVIREEVTNLEDCRRNIAVIATGPLTSPAMAVELAKIGGDEGLYFYDAAAPVITLESVDLSKVFWASRYGKGEADYLNCPMTADEYALFYENLVTAERTPFHSFEDPRFFEGCMPIEQMADRGRDTIRFGPLKPVGLTDPESGKQPYAVVQLRKDNREGTLLNLVGFQTRLKWGEQQRVFRLIPGLENAEFVRYGVMHRNTYLNSPKILCDTYQHKVDENLFIAGQMTGVEGYLESAASGLVAGINAAMRAMYRDCAVFPHETVLGALSHYITTADAKHFQPMNANIGILPPLSDKVRDKRKRNEMMGHRALRALDKVMKIVTF